MIHHSVSQTGLVIHDERDHIAPGNILRGHDGEFVPRDPLTKFDVFDCAAGDAAAHRGPEDHARQGKIINITGLPG